MTYRFYDRVQAYQREYYKKNRERIIERSRADYFRLRTRFFEIYGNQCSCGVKEPMLLTLGHRNNDGKEDRKNNSGQIGVLRRAVEHPDRGRYETQCWNCQHIAKLDHLAKMTYVDNSEMANKRRTYNRRRRNEYRSRAFQIYGPACECCGEADQRVLQLVQKRCGGPGNFYTYWWPRLKDAVEHPDCDKFSILCANCNRGALFNGGACPHKTQTRV